MTEPPEIPAEMKCRCQKCVECRYALFSRASKASGVCFSCRVGNHYGGKLPEREV